MTTAVFSRPIKKVYGETVALTTTAKHLLFQPTYYEVMFYCPSAWRLGIAPRLACVKYYNGTTYTDYTSQAIDRVVTTHVPLDAMTTSHKLYLGFTDPVRGWYEIIDDTNKNSVNTARDVEYLYDVSTPEYYKVTGTAGAAFAVGLTVTGGTSGCTGVTVFDGTSYLILKNIASGATALKKGMFTLDETLTDSSTGSMTAISAIDPVAVGTGYFTDVAADSDGTDSTGTLAQDGLYSFTLPAVVRGSLTGISSEPLYWYRWTPGNTLSATIDVTDIIPVCDTVNYAFMEGGISYQFSMNVDRNGAFEFDHTGTATLDVTWIKH